MSKFLTQHDGNESVRGFSIYPAVIIHGTAIVLSILLVFSVWAIIILNAYGLSKLINWYNKDITLGFVFINYFCRFLLRSALPIADTFPILFTAFMISLAVKTCGAVALIITCALYLLLVCMYCRSVSLYILCI